VAALHLSCKLQSHGRMRRESGSTLLTLAAMDLDKHTIYDGKQVPNPPIMLSRFPFARQWPVPQPPLFGEATSHQQSGSDGGFTIFQAGAVSNRATNPPSWPPDQPEILAALPGPTGPYQVVFI